jgi:hypothetical protein
MPNLQIDETIENTGFLRNCMNMHVIQRRKQPGKLHQYAPDRRHKTSRHKPRDFFIRCRNADFVWIIGSSHHHIIITSLHHRRTARTTPTQRGGDYRGGNLHSYTVAITQLCHSYLNIYSIPARHSTAKEKESIE